MKKDLLNFVGECYTCFRKLVLFLFVFFISFSASAQEETHNASTSIFSNSLFVALLLIMVGLLVLIYALAEVVKGASKYRAEEEKQKKIVNKGMLKVVIALFIISSCSHSLSAQTITTQVTDTYWGLDMTTFYIMLGIITLETFVAIKLYAISLQLLGVEERRLKTAEEKEKLALTQIQPSFIDKLNASVAIEKEADILLDHDYDGIRELDNDLPPWWRYGFYLTIVVSIIYLFHYHVFHTGKLQMEEYEDQLTVAKIQVEEYRKKAANLVDENNATALTDEGSLAEGKSIFMDNCMACHGRSGEGGVGPNLTDSYWLHNGGIKDIFRTIKYGWPEKGMKSWQQDLGAKQIHEIASYIKSLNGTNPPNAKEKQGELYIENTSSDSTQTNKLDSLQVASAKK